MITPTLRMGWRYFHCTDCGRKWKEATRDCFSPSGDNCKCGEWLFPENGLVDLNLPVDSSHNLTMPMPERTVEL